IIPADFSSSIASASTANKKIAEITFTSNEKRNYLAAQILKNAVDQIELSLRGKVNSEIVAELCDKLKSTPEQVSGIADGLNRLSEGASNLKDGIKTLSDGTCELKNGQQAFSSKFVEFEKGINSARDGATQLLEGVNALGAGIDELSNGANVLNNATASIHELRKNAELLATKADEFNQGINAYTSGVDTLIASVEKTSSFLKNYAAANPAILSDKTFSQFLAGLNDPANIKNLDNLKQYTSVLKNASAQISQGTKLLSSATSGIPELKKGIEQLNVGLVNAQNGSRQLTKGSKALKDGMFALSSAASQLGDASKKLSEGAAKADDGARALNEGACKLKDGIDTAKSEVNTSITDAKNKLAALDGLDTFAEAPVITKQEPFDAVPNYGTAFAPYFLSLSMWVGALIIFFAIYLDSDGKFRLLSRNSQNKLLRSFAYLLIGLVQAILLGTILKVFLGLAVKHLFLYYGACCLISMAFISIVQFLMVFLKDIGKFLTIALLILQLTSCGGTFPMETVPEFFNILYPYMPMTYSVGILKEAISGTNGTNVGFNFVVLAGILVVFMALTVILCIIRKNILITAESTVV
ncbi:MAG: YhgE/Pip domain-containing protein, partial [Clostridia bacterium]|nr:YhgE/Pip domain-containing protein [Clostridia bacterium]